MYATLYNYCVAFKMCENRDFVASYHMIFIMQGISETALVTGQRTRGAKLIDIRAEHFEAITEGLHRNTTDWLVGGSCDLVACDKEVDYMRNVLVLTFHPNNVAPWFESIVKGLRHC